MADTNDDAENRFFDQLKNINSFVGEERGVEYNGKCLYCGGTLTGIRSPYNGHLCVTCSGCKFILME